MPEAISHVKTKEEALKNIKEAIEAVLEWRQKKAKGKTIEMVEVTA
ncbi:MAG: type II toxin-antitoxin system HicB family antitoxin [archaeon]|nr:type II toxin-antitoxin system HicB family antitoxin [archaeon]